MDRITARLYKIFLQIRKRNPFPQTDSAASHLVTQLGKWSPGRISTQPYTTVHGSTGFINMSLTKRVEVYYKKKKTFKGYCLLNFVLVEFYATVYHSNPR